MREREYAYMHVGGIKARARAVFPVWMHADCAGRLARAQMRDARTRGHPCEARQSGTCWDFVGVTPRCAESDRTSCASYRISMLQSSSVATWLGCMLHLWSTYISVKSHLTHRTLTPAPLRPRLRGGASKLNRDLLYRRARVPYRSECARSRLGGGVFDVSVA